MNIAQIAKMAQQMQTQMAQAQEELQDTRSRRPPAAGRARRDHRRAGDPLRRDRPSAVDPDEVEMLQDLVMAAINDAIGRSKELERERMATIAGGMGLPGMPGLPGLR